MLPFDETLYETGTPIHYVYFPNEVLISLLTTVDGHHGLKVDLLGEEGVVGISVARCVNTSTMRDIVQDAGSAMRLNTAFFVKN